MKIYDWNSALSVACATMRGVYNNLNSQVDQTIRVMKSEQGIKLSREDRQNLSYESGDYDIYLAMASESYTDLDDKLTYIEKALVEQRRAINRLGLGNSENKESENKESSCTDIVV